MRLVFPPLSLLWTSSHGTGQFGWQSADPQVISRKAFPFVLIRPRMPGLRSARQGGSWAKKIFPERHSKREILEREGNSEEGISVRLRATKVRPLAFLRVNIQGAANLVLKKWELERWSNGQVFQKFDSFWQISQNFTKNYFFRFLLFTAIAVRRSITSVFR